MLRFRQALNDCAIPAQAFVRFSGYSKSLISRVLNSGKLPTDSAKFASQVVLFAGDNAALAEWLASNNLIVEDLLTEWLPDRPTLPLPVRDAFALERLICDIAGRAALASDDNDENVIIIRLARTVSYLHDKLQDLVGEDAPYVTQYVGCAVALLTGE